MNARRDPDRLIQAFLMDGQTELADQVYDAVRSTIERRRQRVFIGPWRLPDMNKLVPIGVGAAAVVGVLFVGSRLMGVPSGPGGSPSTEPSASPSPSVAAQSPSPSSAEPPLTGTFTSARYGITLSYPTGWVARPATEQWITGLPDFLSATGDVVYDPVYQGDLWIAVASQPIGDSAPDDWVAETMALDHSCAATEPIVLDGATGQIGVGDCTKAAVTIDGRGYSIWLFKSRDNPSLLDTYDRAWVEEVLATVQLQPADAAPALTETFTSDRHGFSISYPAGWVTRRATEPWTSDLLPDWLSASGDVINDPDRQGSLWIAVASQPIGDSAPDDWVAETMALDDTCAATEPIVVDGATGEIGVGNCTRAAVTIDGRGYSIWLYKTPDDPSLFLTYDRAWFEEVLATVQLQPGDAVDVAPSAAP